MKRILESLLKKTLKPKYGKAALIFVALCVLAGLFSKNREKDGFDE